MYYKGYEKLLESLRENIQLLHNGKAVVEVRSCQDRKPGCLDPRLRYLNDMTPEKLEQSKSLYGDLLTMNEVHLLPKDNGPSDFIFAGIDVGNLRASMGWVTQDVTVGILTEARMVPARGGQVPVRIYTPQIEKTGRPCLVFFHGGGFFGGTPDVVENQCKLIAQRADAVVVSVDYRLAPEHPFPAGLEDCYDAVCWTAQNADALGIDKARLGVAGDSAGGNLAVMCSLMDRDTGGNHIHYQALLYATLTRAQKGDSDFFWDPAVFENPDGDPYIAGASGGIVQMEPVLHALYVQQADLKNRYMTIFLQEDLSNMPKTLIAVAEYDSLRCENEEFAKRLAACGVSVQTIRYGGVGHAFLDRLGYLPQAEDCINQMADDLMAL